MPITFTNIHAYAAEIAAKKGAFPLTIIGEITPFISNELKKSADKGFIDQSKIETYSAKNISAALKSTLEKKSLLLLGNSLPETFPESLTKPETGFLDKGKTASHIAFFQSDKFGRIILVTDGFINFKIDLDIKQAIVKNSIDCARKIGIIQPKTALMSAVEAVYVKSASAIDDSVISKMGDRGVFGDAFVDGPLSLDTALVPYAAKEKKVKGPVAGNADILVGASADTASGLANALGFFGQCQSAGIIFGGKTPAVFTSRMETEESIVNSIAMAIIVS